MICAILLIAAGCSRESFVDEPKTDDDPSSITLTASMPDEGPQTRMSLDRDNLNVKLKWEAGDQLQLCLKYGDQYQKQVKTVFNISEDGKTASFSVDLPAGAYDTFDLYGVYGGGGLSDSDPTKAILPSAASSTSGSLDDLKTNKVVMLTFAKTGIVRAAPNLSVDLNHLGSLFCIQLGNVSTTSWNNIKKVKLSAISSIGAHNNTGSAAFDLTTNTFSGTTSGNELTFELPSATNLASGTVQEFWGWYPPVSGQNWPEISLKVIDGSGSELKTSTNTKPARASATPAGKAFYFQALYDETNVQFQSFQNLVKDYDGNVYTTVVIGTQEWFVQNLKTTRYNDSESISLVTDNSAWTALTTDAYCWYNNDQTTYGNTYGALYNWYAVNTGKLCPAGWHVATDANWAVLIGYLGDPNVDAGGKLKETGTTHWLSPNAGATNEVGFTALPGGWRSESDGTFSQLRNRGFWWSSTEKDVSNAWLRGMYDTTATVGRAAYDKKRGCSVRCVKD